MDRTFFEDIYAKLQGRIVPSLEYAQIRYEKVLTQFCRPGSVWLDLGCGRRLLREWRYEQELRMVKTAGKMVGLDQSLLSLQKHRSITERVQGDIFRLPFAGNSFDVITANMVFEHLRAPAEQINEIFRVLKPGGQLIFHTPNVLGYTTILARLTPSAIKDGLISLLQKREKEDVFPTFYRMNSPSRIERIAHQSGFRVEKINMICSSAELVLFPFLVVWELLWIRVLMTNPLKPLRTNIIAILEKP